MDDRDFFLVWFDLHHRPYPSPLCWFLTWPTLPLSLLLYSWLFPTGGSVCSHLLTLGPRSRIFLPWRWGRYVPPNRRLTQDLHSATSQKTTFFIVTAVITSNLTAVIITFSLKVWISRSPHSSLKTHWVSLEERFKIKGETVQMLISPSSLQWLSVATLSAICLLLKSKGQPYLLSGLVRRRLCFIASWNHSGLPALWAQNLYPPHATSFVYNTVTTSGSKLRS
jgi:hypothetical protein